MLVLSFGNNGCAYGVSEVCKVHITFFISLRWMDRRIGINKPFSHHIET